MDPTPRETKAPDRPAYGMPRRLDGTTVDEARRRIIAALAVEGFGILTEIDVLAKKRGATFRPYVILGACNPEIAHRALVAELGLGLLLPCNVCVWQEDEAAVISIARGRSRQRSARAFLPPPSRTATRACGG